LADRRNGEIRKKTELAIIPQKNLPVPRFTSPKLATNDDQGSIDKLKTALPNFILKAAS
jgi:hypothetical protein